MSKPLTDPPPPSSRAPEIRKAPKGTQHRAGPGETWVSLARPLGIDPWELIEFNFPGVLALKNRDREAAARQVNWYLETYLGCWESRDGGNNYAFGSTYRGGRGDYQNGMIYLPPRRVVPPPPPPPPSCTAITIPPLDLPLTVRAALALAKVSLPSSARCLDSTEAAYARTIYGESLDYDRIYISDGIGADNRPVTIAVPLDGKWIVILNLGAWTYGHPLSGLDAKPTLIHELAHAWQSQHHSDPIQFMVNCAKSQAAAAAASTVVSATDHPVIGPLIGGVVPGAPAVATLGPADAYSYVPGKFFGDYGGEQVAQQVEDVVKPPAPPKSRHLTSAETASITTIANYMKAASVGQVVAENVRSLGSVKYVHKSFAGVVWHD
jgi:hypothetical protein